MAQTANGLCRDAHYAIPGANPLGLGAFPQDDGVDTTPPGGNSLAFPDDADPSAPITGSCGGNSL